jgi:hypothetical protein
MNINKELRPLLLPWLVAAVAGLAPLAEEPVSGIGALIGFGAFALMAATPWGIEFQERTFPLLLSLPIERSRVWRDKMLAVALATLGLVFANWRVQMLIFEASVFATALFWLFLVATICSSGFWILSTRSALAGVACAILNQLVVCGAIGCAAVAILGPMFGTREPDLMRTLVVGSLAYCAGFVWLGRRYWQKRQLVDVAPILLVVLFCGLAQWLVISADLGQPKPAELIYTCLFVLVTLCSTSFWALVARTSFSGAVLTAASQFVGLAVVLLLASQFQQTESSPDDARFLPFVEIAGAFYGVATLLLGWRRFTRFELKDVSATEAFPRLRYLLGMKRWERWLTCRPNQAAANLARKELRLQKPLFQFALLYLMCWVISFLVLLAYRQITYPVWMNFLGCLYAPACMALAGCLPLGEEKTMGLTASQLSLPVSSLRQWAVKLGTGLCTGVLLGLLFPFALSWFSYLIIGKSVSQKEFGMDAWPAVAAVSGALFFLSFWMSSFVASVVRATLFAVVGLVPLFFLAILGSWCAQQTCGFQRTLWLLVGVDGQLRIPGLVGVIGFAVIVGSICLTQSLRQFRRVRIPASTVVTNSLVLGAGVALGSFWWTAVVLSAGN